jgi:hypothetical protein
LPVLNDVVTSMASMEQRASVVNTMELGKIVASAASPAAFGVAGYRTVFVLAGALLGAYTHAATVILTAARSFEMIRRRRPGEKLSLASRRGGILHVPPS